MSKKVVFDTLKHAKILAKGGVEHPETHSRALAYAITQNIYTINEVDMMFVQALKKFDERTQAMKSEMHDQTLAIKSELKSDMDKIDKATGELKAEMDKIDKATGALKVEMVKSLSTNMMKTVGFLGSLIILVGAVSSFISHMH